MKDALSAPPDVQSANPRSAPSWRFCFSIFAVALVIRAAVGMYQFSRSGGPNALEFPDEHQYWLMAQSLASGNGLRDELGFTATRMPLYPSLLAVIAPLAHGITVAKVIQWLIGSGAAVVTAILAARLLAALGSPLTWGATAPSRASAPILAGFLVALDPFLALTSSLLLTETTYVLLQGALMTAAAPLLHGRGTWWRWGAVGLLASGCVYTRESALVFVALLLLLLCAARWPIRSCTGPAVVAVMVLLSLAPWAYRNKRSIGEWQFLTTRGGISLYDGVREGATGASDLGQVKQMPAVRGLSEAAWDRYFRDESIRLIKEDPMRILRLGVVKLKRTWNPVPNVDTFRSKLLCGSSAAWNVPVYILAIVGVTLLLRRRGRLEAVMAVYLMLPAIYVTMMHSLFVGSVRYRLVAMPALEILAAFALHWLGSRPRRGAGGALGSVMHVR